MSQPTMRVLCGRAARRAAPTRPRALFNLRPRHASRYSSPRTSRNAFDTSPSPTATLSPTDPAAQSDPYIKTPTGPAELQRRMKRLRYASYGLFASVLGTAIVGVWLLDSISAEETRQRRMTQLDAPPGTELKGETFHGRPVHVIGAGEDKRIVASSDAQGDVDLVRTGTSSVPFFPKTIALPAPAGAAGGVQQEEEEYTLLGLGIRSVTFLGIEVYVLGLYVRSADLSALQARLIHSVNAGASTLVPGETTSLKQALLDPTRSAELWTQLLAEDGIKSAWRVSPTKGTDFAHLRDGWVTAIRRGTDAAARLARSKGEGETEYDSEEFGEAVKGFKDVFNGQGRTAKGSVVTLVRDEKGGLGVWFEDPGKSKEEARGLERIGVVQDRRIGRLIWLGYLAGKNVSSEQARQGVVNGCVALASRPVGSAETMVG